MDQELLYMLKRINKNYRMGAISEQEVSLACYDAFTKAKHPLPEGTTPEVEASKILKDNGIEASW